MEVSHDAVPLRLLNAKFLLGRYSIATVTEEQSISVAAVYPPSTLK